MVAEVQIDVQVDPVTQVILGSHFNSQIPSPIQTQCWMGLFFFDCMGVHAQIDLLSQHPAYLYLIYSYWGILPLSKPIPRRLKLLPRTISRGGCDR